MIYDTKMPGQLTAEKCPFCGGEAELVCDGDGVYMGCASSGCLIKPITLTYAIKRDAIKAWNWRGPQSQSDPIVPVGGRLRTVR
ncbi:Lar family restriction alleviation protein [Yersinia enterocolitica]|uniref:Lar family restriction alleviation protein n=2 Tax=Yersinia enterocolitica TaxID=630 RepID=UPI0005FCF0AE|nr:hypothetical protein [Yersinia enterocolitica]CRE89767.1 Uncharacterised protein [Yersinia enterocolitica]